MKIDSRTIEQMCTNDTQAFEVFYEQTYMALYRFVSHFVTSIPDKEDILSETYYNIWHNSARVAQAKNKRAYIYSIAQYEVYKLLRQKQKVKTISITDMKIDLLCNDLSSEEELFKQEVLSLLTKAINRLPEQCKLVYILVKEENMKYEEVADMLCITIGTVKQHMHQALSKIKVYMRSQLES